MTMVSFYVYDVVFLILFTIGVFMFLRSRKKDLAREGWMFMYRSQFGVRAMSWFDKKFHRTLGLLRYVIVTVGFVLMGTMVYLLSQTVWLYLREPRIVEVIRAPPIAPLIPYFPELFGLKSLFPPFYFTYFLVALAVVAIVHEFSHGIYMRYSKTKIKSTGLVFLGPILGAFVEEDKKSFTSKDRFNQMAVLGAGVFANVVFAVIFYALYIGFFYLTFTPGGFLFNSYALTSVNVSDIDSMSEVGNYTVIMAGNMTYYMDEGLTVQLEDAYADRESYVVYYDSPAFNAQLAGVITGIDDIPIYVDTDLGDALDLYSPGDMVTITTDIDGVTTRYDVVLAEHPTQPDEPFLGVSFYAQEQQGFIRDFMATLMGFQVDSTYYKPTVNADIVYFFYHLLWWVMIINVLVALFNMLPLGILDGGRFFYLAVEKFCGKKVAERTFVWVGKLIIASFILVFVVWAYRFTLLSISA